MQSSCSVCIGHTVLVDDADDYHPRGKSFITLVIATVKNSTVQRAVEVFHEDLHEFLAQNCRSKHFYVLQSCHMLIALLKRVLCLNLTCPSLTSLWWRWLRINTCVNSIVFSVHTASHTTTLNRRLYSYTVSQLIRNSTYGSYIHASIGVQLRSRALALHNNTLAARYTAA